MTLKKNSSVWGRRSQNELNSVMGSLIETQKKQIILNAIEDRKFFNTIISHTDKILATICCFITVHRQAKFLQTQFCACNPLDFTDMSLNVQN